VGAHRGPGDRPRGPLPEGFDPWPSLQLSEWRDWDEVVRWALPLYASAARSPAMDAKLAEWRALPDDATRARAALRFVQDEVRYLGIELGPSSHRPHPPAEVFARRFGDCKDKSLLLVTLLRAMGIEAAPALVDTDAGAALPSRLPSPLEFDHVIVRARVAGAERWLEPTRSLERGPVAALAPPPYHRALGVERGTGDLTAIPEPAPAPLEVVTTLSVPRFGAPVRFQVVTTLEGTRAVGMRHTLAETPAPQLQRRYLDYYAHEDPAIRVGAPLAVEDAPDADRVVLTETYELPPVASGADRGFQAEAIWNVLGMPTTALRKQPLGIEHPVRIRERFRIELPGRPDLETERREVASAAGRLTREARVDGNAYVLELEYRSLAAEVAPAGVAGHLRKLRDMRELASFTVPLLVAKPRQVAAGMSGPAFVVLLVGLLLGGCAVVIGTTAAFNGDLRRWWGGVRQWRRRRAFRAKFDAEPGDSPELPLRIATLDAIPARAARLRCACGAPVAPPAGAGERVLYGGREVVVHQLACTRCAGGRRAYFAVEG
jgi:hypothetical protein